MDLVRLLHVDDEEDICTIVHLALAVLGGFELKQFNDGASALAEVRDFDPQLLLLDVMMPGLTGPELREEIHAIPELAHVPFVFMTAKAEESFQAELMETGALAVIVKPFDPVTLADQIKEIWASHQQSPSVGAC